MRTDKYIPRPDYKPKPCCICGRDANFAVSLMVRALERGPKTARRLKASPSVHYCMECLFEVSRLNKAAHEGTMKTLTVLADMKRPNQNAGPR
jgi:hypothetical protein